MTPWADQKVRRSRGSERARKIRDPTLACESQAFVCGPAHGSRRSTNQRTALPIVAIPATRWAECGGPLLTTTCGWNRWISDRARSAARRIQPRPSSGNTKNALTSLYSSRSRPGGPDLRATRDASRNDVTDRSRASRRSDRQPSIKVHRRGHHST